MRAGPEWGYGPDSWSKNQKIKRTKNLASVGGAGFFWELMARHVVMAVPEGFRLGIRKHLFTMRMGKHWNRLSREVGGAPCLSVFKGNLDSALISMP